MWKIAFLVCCLAAVTLAAQSIAPLDPIPPKFKTQKGCYIKELDVVLPVGQTAPSKSTCKMYRCSENYVYHTTCGLAIVDSSRCKLVSDTKKPYPDCCPKLKC